MNLQPVDEDYENRMISSEIDCNDGKGEALACHNVAEYYWYIKEDYERSKKIFERNCTEKDYAASCYYVGKLYCKSLFSSYLELIKFIYCSGWKDSSSR